MASSRGGAVRGRRVGLLRDPDFRRLWTGQSVSMVGSAVSDVALPIVAALTLHAGALQMGVLTAAEMLPYLLVALPIGALVDRSRRRRALMVLADVGRLALIASVPVAAALGVLTYGQLIVVALLAGTLTLAFRVSWFAFLPSLVERDRLLEANARLQTSQSLAQVGGPGIAGALVQAVGAPYALVADAVSYLVSALCLARIGAVEEPPPPPRLGRSGLWREATAGVGMVARDPVLRAIAGSAATLNACGYMVLALLVLFVTRDLGLPPGVLGAVLAVGGLGAVAGALSAARVARRVGEARIIVLATAVFSLTNMAVPLAQGPMVVAATILVAGQLAGGVAVMWFDVTIMAMLQRTAAPAMRARTSASLGFVTQGAKPVGAIVGGVLGELLGVRPALWAAAIGATASVLWTWFSPLRSGSVREGVLVSSGTAPP